MNDEAIDSQRPPKRTRVLAGCQACRVRHQKCDTLLPSCQQCRINGIECVRVSTTRFLYGPDSESRPTSSFSHEQVWMTPHDALQYHDETPELLKFYADSDFERTALPGTVFNFEPSVSFGAVPQWSQNPSHQSQAGLQEVNVKSVSTQPEALSQRSSPQSSTVARFPSTPTAWLDANQKNNFTPSPRAVHAPHESPASLHSAGSTQNPFQSLATSQSFSLDDREAELLRNFSENLALWADVTDLERHFEIDVPRRALSNSILRNAIYTFSSRHMNRHLHGDWTEALEYHNRCLQLLIPVLSGGQEGYTEEILAAVAILRLNEEMDVHDNRFHLTGATRILNSSSSFCSSGGLGEAVAWLCLRQDIYISLVFQQPLRTNLENFRNSQSFRGTDDLSWANRMVHLLARLLSCAFLEHSASNSAMLQQLNDEVENWRSTKPVSFDPIKFRPPAQEIRDRFPTIWMLSPFHVVGYQYYHIARLVLASSMQNAPGPGYDKLREARKTERLVRSHLLIILGLACSNPRAENTLFTARHTLSVWGGVLRNKLDQQAAEDFLRDVEVRTGWSMTQTVQNLREQWEEDAE